MAAFDELSRFSVGGKTFFFNKDRTRGGSEYLTVNTVHGRPARYERLIIFPSQLLEFRSHLTKAIEALAGVKFSQDDADVKTGQATLPVACPNCTYGSGSYGVFVHGDGSFSITCDNCGQELL